MDRGTEGMSFLLEVNGLIQVSHHTLLFESDSETPRKKVEIQGSISVTKRALP